MRDIICSNCFGTGLEDRYWATSGSCVTCTGKGAINMWTKLDEKIWDLPQLTVICIRGLGIPKTYQYDPGYGLLSVQGHGLITKTKLPEIIKRSELEGKILEYIVVQEGVA